MSKRQSKQTSGWSDIDGSSAFIIPYSLLRHANFKRLTPYAVKMLMDLARQYTGFNNGYLCGAWTLARQLGWKSATTARDALAELEHYRIVERSQQGGRNRPNLYALTFRRIDHKDGHPLNVPRSFKPDNAWKEEQALAFSPAERKRKSSPLEGARRGRSGRTLDPQRVQQLETAPGAGTVC